MTWFSTPFRILHFEECDGRELLSGAERAARRVQSAHEMNPASCIRLLEDPFRKSQSSRYFSSHQIFRCTYSLLTLSLSRVTLSRIDDIYYFFSKILRKGDTRLTSHVWAQLTPWFFHTSFTAVAEPRFCRGRTAR